MGLFSLWVSLAILGLLLIAIIPVVAVVGMRMIRRRAEMAPRQRRRFDRKNSIISAVIMAGVATMMFYSGQMWGACMFTLLCAITLYGVAVYPIKHSDVETRVNYAADPSCCGRCDYDLTGNESGICPECGWLIPETPEFVEPVHWAYWWKSWEIQYMERWRGPLAACLYLVVLSLGMIVGFWMWYGEPSPALILLASLGVNQLILVVRIIAYARRQRAQ